MDGIHASYLLLFLFYTTDAFKNITMCFPTENTSKNDFFFSIFLFKIKHALITFAGPDLPGDFPVNRRP